MRHYFLAIRAALLSVVAAFALVACGGGGGGGSTGGGSGGGSNTDTGTGSSSGTGGGGSTSCETGFTLVNGQCQANPPAVPTLTLTSKTQTTVALSWTVVTGASNYTLTRTFEANSSTQTKTGVTNTDTGLNPNTSYSYTIKACNPQAVCSAASVVLVVTTDPPLDTGITASQCYGEGSDAFISCTSAAAISLSPTQDGMMGRDVSYPDNADGKLGFSYSLVPNANGGSYDKTECVKDNITGLMWEGKPASGTTRGNPLLDPNGTYTNYQSGSYKTLDGINPSSPVTQSEIDANTNAQGYLNAVKSSGLCGYNDWRLPTAKELQTLVDYSVTNPEPTIDTTWFPNTKNDFYWSSSPNVRNTATAYIVDFGSGFFGGNLARQSPRYLRLVR